MAYKPHIAPLQRDDIPELSQFLIHGFGVPDNSPFFSYEVLSWKYFDGPSGSTEVSVSSLIARSEGKIVGHIGICPRQFIVSESGASPVSTMHAIDWLVTPSSSGSGAFLILKAFATSQTQYAVGGSAQAQAVFPSLGFEQKPKLIAFRKVLRPLHRLRSSDQGLLRRWAGAAKDLMSDWRVRNPELLQNVELRSVTTFSAEIDCLFKLKSARIVLCHRDHLLLNYFLRCPLPGFSGWTIHTPQRTIGYVLLKITSQGRIRLGKIVDCWLDTDDPSCWQAAVASMIDRLRSLSADTVTCYATTPSLHAALHWNGFTKSAEKNVYVRDKSNLLPGDFAFGLSMLEADHALL